MTFDEQKKVASKVFGCKVNQSELENVISLFVKQGFLVAEFNEIADVYIIHTCAVTEMSEKKALLAIRQAKKNNPQAILVVMGCFAQTATEKLQKIPEIDILLGTNDKKKVVDYVLEKIYSIKKDIIFGKNFVKKNNKSDLFEEYDHCIKRQNKKTRFFLKIQDGCENYCSYCIIPYARGYLRSKELNNIVYEVREAVKLGFKEVVLTGINIGAYGFENKVKGIFIEHVIEEILSIKGLERLRLSSIENTKKIKNIAELMQQDKRFCRHLHIPLQAGDDFILEKMNRRYKTKDFSDTVIFLKKLLPDINITTDIIVGFPMEEEGHFLNTMSFVEKQGFLKVHVFPFSKRKGTLAETFSGEVCISEKKRRVKLLQELAQKCTNSVYERFIGVTKEVLFESEYEGLTDNYLRVFIETQKGIKGKILQVALHSKHPLGLKGNILKV